MCIVVGIREEKWPDGRISKWLKEEGAGGVMAVVMALAVASVLALVFR